MNRKHKLLSIGEAAKLTGASVKSLRYYEQLNLLKPAYVAPDSGYRYYTTNQLYIVGIIKFAIEMDIPLKEISHLLNSDGIVNFQALSSMAKEVANKKIQALEHGLKFVTFFEQQFALWEKYPVNQIYTRTIPEKFLYLIPIPHNKAFDRKLQYEDEVISLFFDLPYDETSDNVSLEHGLLLEHSPDGVKRYVFVEVPKRKANYRPIPAGLYHCRKGNSYNIEQSQEIFTDYLADTPSFIAIETEIISAEININNPISELRVIAL